MENSSWVVNRVGWTHAGTQLVYKLCDPRLQQLGPLGGLSYRPRCSVWFNRSWAILRVLIVECEGWKIPAAFQNWTLQRIDPRALMAPFRQAGQSAHAEIHALCRARGSWQGTGGACWSGSGEMCGAMVGLWAMASQHFHQTGCSRWFHQLAARGNAVSDFQSEHVRQVVPGAKNGLSARVMLLSKAQLDDGGDRWVCQNEYGSPLNHLNH